VVIASEQGNFINGLCMPLYKALVNLFPTTQPCVDQMQSNGAMWAKKYDEFEDDNWTLCFHFLLSLMHLLTFSLDLTKPRLQTSGWVEDEV
jgi:hypothetical protein